MPKGHKRVRGIPELHDELKKRVSIALTPRGIQGLDALAAQQKISRSELVERIGRGLIATSTASVKPIARQVVNNCPHIYLEMEGDRILDIGQEAELRTKLQENPHFQRFYCGSFNMRVTVINRSDDVDIDIVQVIDSGLIAALKPELYQEDVGMSSETLLELSEQLKSIAKVLNREAARRKPKKKTNNSQPKK
jgi:metal-responsive CopG/Arc/MetJ family transcriptional regulator